jgi:hypothetical protein
VTYYSDRIRPPADGRLSALMTHSAIGSYVSHLWEMLCLLCAVAAVSSLFEHIVVHQREVYSVFRRFPPPAATLSTNGRYKTMCRKCTMKCAFTHTLNFKPCMITLQFLS